MNSPQGKPPPFELLLPALQEFCQVVAVLRGPDGCPWDREQTLETIKPYTLEETYELLEAIDSGDDTAIVEELGDVLLQVVLDAQIGADEGRFGLLEVVEGVTRKLVHRHPHVFGDETAETSEEVRRNWDSAKRAEKQREGVMDGLPLAMPALARAARITGRAARVGYDFPDRRMLFDKLREELAELAVELFDDGSVPEVPAEVDAEVIEDEPLADDVRDRAEEELGDVLFVLANIARRWGINAEEALRRSSRKFERRFRAIEDGLAAQGGDVQEASLVEMEEVYQAAKAAEK
ncbi:MAG: nucleoside triphosphate pyrophosphohydrolase [Planctomycetaceae bacterium]|jgi:tetrapyrrole methylase family protein/MazG family protein|nr:nucleoside triphosphate pyrophosphohydrolase [Planctomycetaceae bacterium]MCH2587418.1 nucleoside triphosphate pyrophosphohydrolase [Planctomycetales bacterium]MED5402093.1 nucleoside triphosphate pyrophosphohydrolase [Planctomycetota bacterium]|tara:strand:+ start:887 stop:1765 length:879 start_codon:yes stop_codon:yes gene_type:complete